jgi:hypothetical protein
MVAYTWPHTYKEDNTIEYKVDLISREGNAFAALGWVGNRLPWGNGFDDYYVVLLRPDNRLVLVKEKDDPANNSCAVAVLLEESIPAWDQPIVLSLRLRRAGESMVVTARVTERDDPGEPMEWSFVDGPGVDPVIRGNRDSGPPPYHPNFSSGILSVREVAENNQGEPVEFVFDNYECLAQPLLFPLVEIQKRASRTYVFWQPSGPQNRGMETPDGDWVIDEGPQYDLFWAGSPAGPWHPWTEDVNTFLLRMRHVVLPLDQPRRFFRLQKVEAE